MFALTLILYLEIIFRILGRPGLTKNTTILVRPEFLRTPIYKAPLKKRIPFPLGLRIIAAPNTILLQQNLV